MPHPTVRRHFDAMVLALAALSLAGPVRMERVDCGLQVVVEVRPVNVRRTARYSCKRDVLWLFRATTTLPAKSIIRRLQHKHGKSTIVKALADLTRSGELVNRRDHTGYRLPTELP